MGVPTALIRAIYSVVKPPTCIEDPYRPQAKGIPDSVDVQHILTQLTRRINESSSFRVSHSAVIHAVVYTDTEGIGTYYITTMLHEATTSISLRVSIKARMPVTSSEAPHILNVSFDPQSADPDPTDPSGVGRVPYADAKPLR